MRAKTWLLTIAAAALLACGACGKDKPKGQVRGSAELGEPCEQTQQCRPGLICLGETCAPRDARSTPRELEKAYELNEDRTQGAIDRYSPYKSNEEDE